MAQLTVPHDSRYRDTVRALSARVAEFMGYGGRDVRDIAEAVDRAVGGLLAQAPADAAPASIAIAFAAGDETFEIRVSSGVELHHVVRPLPPEPSGRAR